MTATAEPGRGDPTMLYDDLRLSVRPIGGGKYLVVAGGAVSTVAIVRPHDDAAGAARRFRGLVRAELDGDDELPDVDGLGREVAALLFPEPLRDELRDRVRDPAALGHGLRVRVELPDGLADHPVETAVLPDWQRDGADRPLVRQNQRSLVRTVPGAAPSPGRLPQPGEEPAVISLLVVVAHADGCELDGEEFAPLSVAAEVAALEKRLAGGENPLGVRTTVLGVVGDRAAADRATRGRLQAWLSDQAERPAAVAVLAHGRWNAGRDRGEILLENEDGSVDPVSGEALATDLLMATRLRLAVLNLCSGGRSGAGGAYSSVAQEMVAQGIPAVVAMQTEISDQAATALTPELVGNLVAGHTVDHAVARARQAVIDARPPGTVEWAVPVVALSPHCSDGVLFRPRSGRDAGDPSAALRRAYESVTGETGRYGIDQLVDAARWVRQCGEWEEVARLAGTRPDDPRANALLEEARIELARGDLLWIADLLRKEADPDEASASLERHRPFLPASVTVLLDRELSEAADLAELHWQAEDAERAGQWEDALEYWSEIDRRRRGYRECAVRRDRVRRRLDLREALGRAEREGAWGRAAELCRGAEGLVGDSDLRARYYLFRDADATGEVDGVLTGYPDLPDEHADGDVGRRRVFARAARHAGTGNRAAALAGLDELADTALEGRVAARRCQWAAELAELRGDWPEAAERYLAHPDPEAWAQAAAYALACAAEEDGDWRRAAALWSGIDPVHRDVARRAGYAAGRVAEQDGHWSEAMGHYRALSAADRDVSARTAYCAQRLDPDRPPDPALGGHPDGPALVAYLAGIGAERAGDWPGAARAFGLCPGHQDSELRRAYARGRADDADGRWSAALAAYRTVLAGADPGAPGTDTADRARRVEVLSARLPFLDGLAADGLVVDPGTPQAEDPPAGLRHVVDDPQGLRTAQSALLAADVDPFATLVAAAPGDAALLQLLAGRPEDAVSAWHLRVADDAGDTAALHHLAVRAHWSDEPDPAPRWAAVLADGEYHDRWSTTTGRDAGSELARASSAAADPEETAVELFGARAVRSLGGHPAHGPRLTAGLGRRADLVALAEAVDAALREDGVDPDPDAVFDLGGDVDGARDPRPSWRGLRVLRLAFSPLAGAAAAAAAGDLDTARDRLESLIPAEDLPVTAESDCAPSARVGDHVDGCSACAAYLRDAPVHRSARHRAVLLAQDGVALAAGIHLGCAVRSLERARTSIGNGRLGGHGDLDDAVRAFGSARDWADSTALGSRLRERVTRTAAAWVDDLTRTHHMAGYVGPTGPVDAAIVLLRGTVAVVGAAGPLVDRLTRLLYRRRHPDTWRVRRDLYEALGLNPSFVDARAALVEELSPHSGLPDAEGWSDAAEAVDVVEAAASGGDRLHPDMQDALRRLARDVADLAMRSLAVDERETVLGEMGGSRSPEDRVARYRERADRAVGSGRPDLALVWWCEALHTRPSDADLRHTVAVRVRDRAAVDRRPAGGDRQ